MRGGYEYLPELLIQTTVQCFNKSYMDSIWLCDKSHVLIGIAWVLDSDWLNHVKCCCFCPKIPKLRLHFRLYCFTIHKVAAFVPLRAYCLNAPKLKTLLSSHVLLLCVTSSFSRPPLFNKFQSCHLKLALCCIALCICAFVTNMSP